MAWGKVVEYFLAFLKWVWKNKWTLLFILTTCIMLGFFGCEKRTTKKLTDELKIEKTNYITLTARYDVIDQTYNNNITALKTCQNNLKAIETSYRQSKVLIDSFDQELDKFRLLSKDIDNIKNMEEQFNAKKTILQSLFKGKNAVQIRKTIRSKKDLK